jgi:hypothetical protein
MFSTLHTKDNPPNGAYPAGGLAKAAGHGSNSMYPGTPSKWLEGVSVNNCRETENYYGALLEQKQKHILCIGFQNIGCLSTIAGSAKDDFLRASISKFDFNIFGIVEVSTGHRCKNMIDYTVDLDTGWLEHCNCSQAYNVKTANRNKRQYGGVAQWIGKAVYRIMGTGHDEKGLGRWT